MTYEEEIEAAVKVLKDGKVMLYPTDTIWGLGCDATNPKAVEKIYRIKQRSENKSLIALIDSEERLKTYVKKVPEIAFDLIQNAANPISIVYPGAQNLAKNAIGSDKTVCIRVTTNEFWKGHRFHISQYFWSAHTAYLHSNFPRSKKFC